MTTYSYAGGSLPNRAVSGGLALAPGHSQYVAPVAPSAPAILDTGWGAGFRKAGDAFSSFLTPGRLRAGVGIGALLAGANELGDQTPGETPLANLFDAAGAVGGSVGGAKLGSVAAGLMTAGKVMPHPLLKAALMGGGMLLGSGAGQGISRAIGDVVTGGATRNTPENQALRTQEALFQQQLRQRTQEIATLLPAQKAQAVAAAEIEELRRRADFQRQLDAGYANTLYGSLANQGARNSDMVANAINSVLYS